MYFIRQGIVEVYNADQDANDPTKPILYLPKFSYFGDYQILHKLKSNLNFRTLKQIPENKKRGLNIDEVPNTYFMCISKKKLLELCDLFPQTAENIKIKALERRQRFIQQKHTNSRRY